MPRDGMRARGRFRQSALRAAFHSPQGFFDGVKRFCAAREDIRRRLDLPCDEKEARGCVTIG